MIKCFLKKITPSFAFFLLVLTILNSFLVINWYKEHKIKNKITRLHVVANSNMTEDQIIKFKVYENVKNYIDTLSKNNNLDSLDILKENSNEILEIANETLEESSAHYKASLAIGKIKYDDKQSISLDMPAGSYNSLKIVLGQGNGKNIWSLIFPSSYNIDELKPLETTFPGISKIYENEKEEPAYSNKTSSFKIIKKLKKLKIPS